ncbi:MAG TPA: FG-GAP-like repeat-containing protein [Mucilaginibacter sp.]|nr:FG-GAP-like repeat-containing protein [Mucilaginibacter sp.]
MRSLQAKALLILLLFLGIFGKIYAQAPIINSFSPASGAVGSTVTITGNNFNTTAGSNVVFFGGVKAAVISATTTSLKVKVPSGSTFQPITVLNASTGLQGYSAEPFLQTFDTGDAKLISSNALVTNTITDTHGGFQTFLQLVDIDGDGKLDLVIVDSFDQTLNIYKNSSVSGSITSNSLSLSATFNVPMQGVTYTPNDVKFADLDGDGKPDLIVPYLDQNAIAVYKNITTTGTISNQSFAAQILLQTGSAPYGVATADIDGDGKPEIIVTNNLASSVSVFKNVGAKGTLSQASFMAKQDFSINSDPTTVQAADIDGDGKVDLVVGTSAGFSVLKNGTPTGSQSFSFTRSDIKATGSLFCAYAADIDGDGKIDVLLISPQHNGIGVYKNTTASGSAITFAAESIVNTTGSISGLVIADINGDGKPDLVIAPYAYNYSIIPSNSSVSSISFGPEVDLLVQAPDISAVVAGDIDGDGKNDIIGSDGYAVISLFHNSIVGFPTNVFTTDSVRGIINACVNTPAVKPFISKFTVSAVGLTSNATATAPLGFELSLSPDDGYGSALTLPQSNGTVNNVTLYIRAAASAQAGSISGNVVLASAGINTKNIAVTGLIFDQATAIKGPDQIFTNGAPTPVINLPGSSNSFNWTNDNPAIGLPASGNGNIASFKPVNTGMVPIKANITVYPNAPEFAYIPNTGDNTVSVINVGTSKVIATIKVGTNPSSLAVSPYGDKVYVLCSFSSKVDVISTATNTIIASIPVGQFATQVTLSPDGNWLYVPQESNVLVINTQINQVQYVLPGYNDVSNIALSPDGTIAYETDGTENVVLIVSTVTRKLLSAINNIPAVGPVAVSPDGNTIYVTSGYNNSLYVINPATHTILATVPLNEREPNGIAVSRDGKKVFVVTGVSSDVCIIDAQAYKLITTVGLGLGQAGNGIGVSPDGSKVYATNPIGNTVWVIDALTNKALGTIRVGSGPEEFGGGSFITGIQGCPGTPVQFTITVNPATIFLPQNNFTIAVTSATCRGSKDGSVKIEAAQSLNYIATITGNGLNSPYPFTDSVQINNLSAGTYNVCITITGQSGFSQCYDVVVAQPQDLSVYSTVNPDNSLTLMLNGGNQYNITLNGTLHTTSDNFITLPLAVGNNDLKVTTDRLCQGTYQKIINVSGNITPYPVPFEDVLNLNLGNTIIGNVIVKINDISTGKLVLSGQYSDISGVLQLDTTPLGNGAYVLHLLMNNTEKIFKIVKK